MVTTPKFAAKGGETPTTAAFATFDDEEAAAKFIEACHGKMVPELGPGVLQVC